MKKIFGPKDFIIILNEITDHGYDRNYASVIASDYIFEENPEFEFSEDFSKQYNLIMDYLFTAYINDDQVNFERIVNDLKKASESNILEKEDIVYILEKKTIEKYEDLYRRNKINYDVFRKQIIKLGDKDFNFNAMIEKYFGA